MAEPTIKPDEVATVQEQAATAQEAAQRIQLHMPVDVRSASLGVLALVASLWAMQWAKEVNSSNSETDSLPGSFIQEHLKFRNHSQPGATKLASGVDPRVERREVAERERVAHLNTFELLARTWLTQAQKDRQWSAGYAEKVRRHLEIHIFPWIGRHEVATIAPTELVRCLHRIKERGHLETAQRVREAVLHVYQYVVDVGALHPSQNFVNSRTGGLPAPRSRHYAAITDPEQLGAAIARYCCLQGPCRHARRAATLADAVSTAWPAASGPLGRH